MALAAVVKYMDIYNCPSYGYLQLRIYTLHVSELWIFTIVKFLNKPRMKLDTFLLLHNQGSSDGNSESPSNLSPHFTESLSY